MKVHLASDGFEMSSDLEKYAYGKAARLNRRVPRRLRQGADCQIYFAVTHRKGAKFNTCSIVCTFDDTELRAEETTLHMYAALDIAAVHVEHQLAEYVARHKRQGIRARFRRHFGN